MADRPEERELTPAEEERVRRLLADARHTEPAPDAVVARLDAVLAGLAAGDAEGVDGSADADAPVAATVTDLASARRRRRRVTQVLVAAAAVTVVGLAGPQLIGGASDMLTAGGSSDSGASSAAGEADDGPENAPEARGPLDTAGGADGLDFSQAETITPGSFDRQVRGLRKEKSAAPLASASGEPDTNDATREGAAAGAYSALRACRGDAVWGPGERVPVVYDGSPGVLIYRPASDGSQIVDLYLCGDTSPTRSVALHPST